MQLPIESSNVSGNINGSGFLLTAPEGPEHRKGRKFDGCDRYDYMVMMQLLLSRCLSCSQRLKFV